MSSIAGRWQGEACGADWFAAEANKQLVHQPTETKLAQQFAVGYFSQVEAQAVD